MTRKNYLWGILLMSLTLAMSACGITVNRVETGELRTERINIAKPTNTERAVDVELRPGAASFEATTGSNELVEGTIEYNVLDWKPSVIHNANRVVIQQNGFVGVPPTDMRNDWRIKLGKGVPIDLTIGAGAVRGSMELGGLSLRSFTYRQGAADASIWFNQANEGQMSHILVEAGASRLSISGLAYCNASSGAMNIGAGALSLSFDGKLTRDLDITIEGGAASVTIHSGGNPVQTTVSQGFSAVTANSWTRNGRIYSSPEWNAAKGPKVTIHTNLGAATLTLLSGDR